jgi:hypothetical protein
MGIAAHRTDAQCTYGLHVRFCGRAHSRDSVRYTRRRLRSQGRGRRTGARDGERKGEEGTYPVHSRLEAPSAVSLVATTAFSPRARYAHEGQQDEKTRRRRREGFTHAASFRLGALLRAERKRGVHAAAAARAEKRGEREREREKDWVRGHIPVPLQIEAPTAVIMVAHNAGFSPRTRYAA